MLSTEQTRKKLLHTCGISPSVCPLAHCIGVGLNLLPMGLRWIWSKKSSVEHVGQWMKQESSSKSGFQTSQDLKNGQETLQGLVTRTNMSRHLLGTEDVFLLSRETMTELLNARQSTHPSKEQQLLLQYLRSLGFTKDSRNSTNGKKKK